MCIQTPQPYMTHLYSLGTCIYSTASLLNYWIHFLNSNSLFLCWMCLTFNSSSHVSMSPSLPLSFIASPNTQQCPHDISSHSPVSLFSFGCSSQCVCETKLCDFCSGCDTHIFFPSSCTRASLFPLAVKSVQRGQCSWPPKCAHRPRLCSSTLAKMEK